LFESEFLTFSSQSKEAYRQGIIQAVNSLCDLWPERPFTGRNASALAALVPTNFLPWEGSPIEEIVPILRDVIANSIAVSHPATTAHLHCPPLAASLAAEVVISALNQSMDSFDQAPIATVVEQKIIRWLSSEARLPASSSGTFTTGGSQSNYMGLLLARDAFLHERWNWSAQKDGLPPDSRKLRILCSEVAHFTVKKSAAQLGLGTSAVVPVGVDEHFRIDPSALSQALDRLRRQQLLPMAVVATAGTTDFGSIDPLHEIADLARSSGLWLHVDAAYGGALLFSAQHRHKLRSLELADSIAIDFHKLFWQPIPTSVFLLGDARHFDSIEMHADYLNPEIHDAVGIPNLVTTSLLTSRRFDALKLWISCQSLGRSKLAAMIDRTIELANHSADLIRRTRSLELLCEPQLSTVVFRYVPSQTEIAADEINLAIRRRLFDHGQAVIGHTRVRSLQCLKFTCMNPTVTEAQMAELVRAISDLGADLERGMQAAER
jgi:L-2,4-diaminobutyrate decarboxylase